MATLTASASSSLPEPAGVSGSSSTEAAKMGQDINAPSPSSRLERCNTAPFDLTHISKRPDIPTPRRRLHRQNSSSSRPPMSPAPPDSPNSLPPISPYVVNHKRRLPRLHKSYSYAHLRRLSEGDIHEEEPSDEFLIGESKVGEGGDVVRGNAKLKILTNQNLALKRDHGETDDFFDPNNIDGDDYGGDLSSRMYTPMAEFYDAWEEQSFESGRQSQRSFFNAEIELREMRLSLVTEMKQRKQAEEALKSMLRQSQLLREKLATAGLNLSVDLDGLSENQQSDADPVEDLSQQVRVTHFVSESIGWAAAKAEAEDELKAQLEAKNFEIARLSDRMHYYEIMNREMSQRNLEATDIMRRERQKIRRRQELIWGSVGAAITLGIAALVWSFTPCGKSSSSTEVSKSDSKPH